MESVGETSIEVHQRRVHKRDTLRTFPASRFTVDQLIRLMSEPKTFSRDLQRNILTADDEQFYNETMAKLALRGRSSEDAPDLQVGSEQGTSKLAGSSPAVHRDVITQLLAEANMRVGIVASNDGSTTICSGCRAEAPAYHDTVLFEFDAEGRLLAIDHGMKGLKPRG